MFQLLYKREEKNIINIFYVKIYIDFLSQFPSFFFWVFALLQFFFPSDVSVENFTVLDLNRGLVVLGFSFFFLDGSSVFTLIATEFCSSSLL